MISSDMQSFSETHFQFEGQSGFYRGKVRDVYFFGDRVAIVATDRISAFDTVFPYAIPDKGRVLNQLATRHLNMTKDIVPNWMIATPDPNVTIGFMCDVFPIEIVVRGYLSGHAWREYKLGKRVLCGVQLPHGLKENDPLPEPIITPTTKASTGQDRDITKKEIINHKIIREDDYTCIENYALKLYEKGVSLSNDCDLILADTKYEFGKHKGTIYLVDELHTPDSSRYFYKAGYKQRQAKGEPQKHLSKEFVRQWSIANGFQGKTGQQIANMTKHDIVSISNLYKELYKQMAGYTLDAISYDHITERIKKNIIDFMY